MELDIQRNNFFEMQQTRLQDFLTQNPQDFDLVFEFPGERLLYANKFMVRISPMLKAAISDIWSKEEEPIKIEAYTYEEFYQFLLFIYSGACEIHENNITRLLDMTEFYGVDVFKRHLDSFFSSKAEVNIENMEKMVDMAQTYILNKFQNAIDQFAKLYLPQIADSETFLAFKRSTVQYIASFSSHENVERVFDNICKWADHQVKTKFPTSDLEDFDFNEAVKTELAEVLPIVKFSQMNLAFIKKIVAEKSFLFSSKKLYHIITNCMRDIDEEKEILQMVYRLAHEIMLKRYVKSSDLSNAIKEELQECLPAIKLYRIQKAFIVDFAAKMDGVILPMDIKNAFNVKIQIKSMNKIIAGNFEDDIDILKPQRGSFIREKDSWLLSVVPRSDKKLRFTGMKFAIPKSQSSLNRLKGAEWYLCLEKDGILTAKHTSKATRHDYLIADLHADENFSFTLNMRTYVTVIPAPL